jgi:hypothetical protein
MVKALALLLLAVTVASPAAGAKETWDHVANIKDAATRLAALHNREGSTGVLKFLDACYRTQMLASEFSQGLESCMAQDYMHSQVLAQIYARIPQAERVRMGTPAPEDIARGMGERFVAAFSQYKMTVKEADNFKKLVDKNGMPIFIKGIFPKKKPGDADSAGNGDDAGKTDKK